ncbi:MAG: CBS domain-containing protein [Myxococcales bacterium]|nr:CBS domain-containing protein [Myxococcales bacterium]
METRDYMTPRPVTVPPSLGARQAFETMQALGIRHLPVLDDQGVLVGMVSDRDLRRPAWVDGDAGEHFALTDQLTVADVMSREVTVIRAEAPLVEAAMLFVERQFGALPVVDGGGEVVGVLSTVDLLEALVDGRD